MFLISCFEIIFKESRKFLESKRLRALLSTDKHIPIHNVTRSHVI